MGKRALGIASAVFLVVALGACDWLQPFYDAGHSGYNPSESALTTSTVKTLTSRFTISTTGRTYGLPIVSGTNLYATSFEPGTGTARIEQFDATNGTPGWSTTLSTGVTHVTNAAAGSGSVFAVTYDSATSTTKLFGVSTSDGSVTLDVTLPSAGTAPPDPIVDQGRVFVTLWLPGAVFAPWGSVEVLAVDATSGATVWTTGGQASTVSTVGTAVGSGSVVFAYNCCARPGLPQGLPATDVVHESDGTHVSSTDDELLDVVQNSLAYGEIFDPNTGMTATAAVEPATGTVKWSTAYTSAFAVSGTSAVFVTSGAGVAALDAKTGATQWTSPASGDTFASAPVIASGVVYLVTGNGTVNTLRTYDAKTGAVAGSLTVAGNGGAAQAPVVSNGRVYVEASGAIAVYVPSSS